MNKETVTQSEIKLVGLTVRTNNKNEMNPAISKIGELAGRYWGQNIASQIPSRKNPGVTFSVYTEDESNEHGDYTYFVGEEVDSFENIPSDMQQLAIPTAKYQKFTTTPGKMPGVVINAWQQIWKMTASDLGCDPSNAIVDIYIGIR